MRNEFTIKVNDIEMDYISFGKGTKPLVMIQGLNTNGIKGAGATLSYMYRVFAKNHKVYLFDRRKEVYEGITVRQMASDIAAAMDALELKDADVLGVSQGGMIAQYLAIDRSDLVSKLVLTATLSRNNETVIKVIDDWIDMTERRKMKELVSDMSEKLYTDEYVRRYKPFMPLLTIMQKPKDIQRFIILAKACLTCDTYNELKKIKCPVLVIGGGKDKIVSAEASKEIAEKLECPIFIYDDLGHSVYEEAKDFNKRVYDFFCNRN